MTEDESRRMRKMLHRKKQTEFKMPELEIPESMKNFDVDASS